MSDVATLSEKLGQAAKLHRLLEKDGLSEKALQYAVDDTAFRKKLVLFWERRGLSTDVTESDSQKAARKLLGKNFVGLPEVAEHFNLIPTEDQMAAMAEIPIPEGVLKACRQTHVLVADLGLSILDVRSRVDCSLFYSHEDSWYNDKEFAQTSDKPCWRLIRKNIVTDSTKKTWEEQKGLLDENEEVPTARALVHTIILFYLARGERMLENVYARTSTSVRSDDFRVGVGYFGSDGLRVDSYWDGHRNVRLGVLSARKF